MSQRTPQHDEKLDCAVSTILQEIPKTVRRSMSRGFEASKVRIVANVRTWIYATA